MIWPVIASGPRLVITAWVNEAAATVLPLLGTTKRGWALLVALSSIGVFSDT